MLNKNLMQVVTLGCMHEDCKSDHEGILAPSGLTSHYRKSSCIFQHTFKVVLLILLKLI